MEKLVKVKKRYSFRNSFIATIVSLAVVILLDIIGYIFNIELTFLKGCFACASYFIILKYEYNIDNLCDLDKLEELKKNNKELEETNKYLHIRVEELNSQITTERCIGYK